MGKGPSKGAQRRAAREAEEQQRRRFASEALRKRYAGQKNLGGRPPTLLKSSINPETIGTSLIVGKG